MKYYTNFNEVVRHIIQTAIHSILYIRHKYGTDIPFFSPHDVFMVVIKYEDDHFAPYEKHCNEIENAITNKGKVKFDFNGRMMECEQCIPISYNRLQREFTVFKLLDFKIRND